MVDSIAKRLSFRNSLLAALAAALIAFVIAGPSRAVAQQADNDDRPAAQQHDNDMNRQIDRDKDDRNRDQRGNMSAFDAFLDSHPKIANDLAGNPRLIDDQNFVNSHPELKEFLESHPNVREEVRGHPDAIRRHERNEQMSGDRDRDRRANGDNDIRGYELKNFDTWLDKHPQIGQELRSNPSLVNDPNYVNSHTELKGFLDHHQSVREELRENPRAFMKAEGTYENKERH